MVDDELKNVSSEDAAGNEQYIAAIKELKENSVSKEDFLKLKQENKQLLNALVDGQTVVDADVKPKLKSIEELEQHLFEEGISNLDYITTSLEIRNRTLEEKGIDLYCPEGAQYNPTLQDRETARNVAEQFQEMIDLANGSSEVFNAELQRRTQDIIIPIKKK